MTHAAALAVRPADGPAAGSPAPAMSPVALRLAPSRVGLAPCPPPGPTVHLRTPDLLADLRQARAARFADRYAWLALRRRRAQIAARHALGRP
jgi:hypothetical protein